MFGLEILDVVIGLMFVYLLLSLLATAINEYISALMNLRGKELARGLGRLLDDVDEKEALKKAFDGVGASVTSRADELTKQLYNHPLIRPLATRRGLLFRRFSKEPRLPSYIPARTFAQALLDVLGVQERDANLTALPAAASPPATPVAPGADHPKPEAKANLARVLLILKRESPLDVAEYLGDLKALIDKADFPADAKLRLVEGLTASQTQLQRLHDSVEVWFNNSMDRVSGAYKRTIQGWLFIIGLVIAVSANADTIQMWRQLSANEDLAEAMAGRAAATLPLLDSVVHRPAGTSAPGDSVASARYQVARARLDSMELRLGWTHGEARRIGVVDADSTFAWTPKWIANPGFWGKLLGLLLTGIALALGAPFWFDLLNKVISIRAAGRSPAEKPKSPEGAPKRAAEETPK